MPHILCVEDNEIVSHMIKETLETEGWRVECRANGLLALSEINSPGPYDLLLLDNELPGISGLELTWQARRLPHRKEVLIIMMSASEAGEEAQRAGADLFLKKPEGIKNLVETIKQLLNIQDELESKKPLTSEL
jgi:CheY-like chemotaxis protein